MKSWKKLFDDFDLGMQAFVTDHTCVPSGNKDRERVGRHCLRGSGLEF